MADRVLVLHELNRATLAWQLLLERKPRSPRAVIERLVGMQAQSPKAPYIGILPEEFRKTVIQTNGDVAPTFLVDGLVAGTWRIEGAGRVVTAPFGPLPRAARRELEEESDRLQAWLTDRAEGGARALRVSGVGGKLGSDDAFHLTLTLRRSWTSMGSGPARGQVRAGSERARYPTRCRKASVRSVNSTAASSS